MSRNTALTHLPHDMEASWLVWGSEGGRHLQQVQISESSPVVWGLGSVHDGMGSTEDRKRYHS